MDRRRRAEDQTAPNTEQHGEGEGECIHSGGKQDRKCANHWRKAQCRCAPNGEGCSEACSQESEQHIFRKYQADDAPASRAERYAHGHLALPGASTSQHEVCGVAADRQLQEQHNALQDGEPTDQPPLRTARRFPEWMNLGANSGAGLRIVARKLGHRRTELGLGFLACRARA